MNNAKLSPLKIKVDKKIRKVFINWNNNHNTEIGFGLLRAACPCATCRGGHENMKPEPDIGVFIADLPISSITEIEKLNMVGSYGFTVMWADGHHYGIYTWFYLRALCDCEECRRNRK